MRVSAGLVSAVLGSAVLGSTVLVKCCRRAADNKCVNHETPAPASPIGEFPLLVWLLATLAVAHAGATVADLVPGGAGAIAAGADIGIGVALVVGLVLGWGRTGLPAVQGASIGLIALAALASGLRTAVSGQPWWGLDVLIAVFAAAALTARRDVALALVSGLVCWSGALAGGVVLHSSGHWAGPASWVLIGLLLAASVAVAAGARFDRASARQALDTLQRRAERQSVIDPLTGVHNRRGLELFALPMIEHARRQGEAVHCLFIDLDDFRQVNEQLGRGHGDLVLVAACEAVLASVRGTDVVARWGGDQFVVVGPGTGTSPLELERRVRNQLSTEPPAPKEVWSGRVSIGAATLVPWDEGHLDTLLHRSEEDMQLRRTLRRRSKERTGTSDPPAGPTSAAPDGRQQNGPPNAPTAQKDL